VIGAVVSGFVAAIFAAALIEELAKKGI